MTNELPRLTRNHDGDLLLLVGETTTLVAKVGTPLWEAIVSAATPPAPAPADDHPPSRHCGCCECVPRSFEANPPAPAAPVSDGYVYIRLKRPEGYEDVHPDLVLQDAHIHEDFCPELLGDPAATQQAEPAEASQRVLDAIRRAGFTLVKTQHGVHLVKLGECVAQSDPSSTTQQAEPNNSWLPHNGGPCPVALDVLVDVKLRNGRVSTRFLAEHLDWKHSGEKSDIIEYRLHREGGA